MSAPFWRVAEFGDFIVYERGAWAQRERLPRYVVLRNSDNRALEEFRRRMSAVRWARQQAEAEAHARAMLAE